MSLLLFLIISGCKKDTLLSDPSAKLEFSVDTLTFDTVFTGIGSATRLFKVYNNHKQRIKISAVSLGGLETSSFRMNVDGIAGTSFKDLEIAAEDSMYVFVEVTVDPNSQNTPFIVTDSILFTTNGNVQDVKLQAFGQNAHFFDNEILCTQTWTNDKPYVLLGSVLVDTLCTLTISEGVRIFMHANANLIVSGKLIINGSEDSLVNFEGDRLEAFFDDLPGQWGGIIILRGSTGNIINNAMINEATSGIVIGSSTSSDLNDFTSANKPDITVSQTTVKNSRSFGLFSFFSDVSAENILIHSSGENNMALLYGGIHRINHSTIANYGVLGIDHKSPVLRLTNYAIQNQTEVFVSDLDALFTNSIFYGNIPMGSEPEDGEVEIDLITDQGTQIDYLFEYCFLRTNLDINNSHFDNTSKNIDPLFMDVFEGDYSLQAGSPCIDAGKVTAVIIDLPGTARDAMPDVGAFEGGN